ncbi:hypothetical protein [Xanthomonas rydalmerensis]|uniref:Uncharacterized protein n=1 Tax=Xanthomonas rydalmerensis TaxID=3046274 RepID=A0ABZ0JLN4_9XANT|nr:hypothetical protein [Xanthomonas sp. DM-2023]WOS40705.1 hypothetical protein QN243_20305 [Xanthomonas sp. DM-2023]WOS44889.1 hypothetical protein QN242_20305 [Xanthomonas sp. DM-2023]WOS49069.1 hypothetical protein QN240_20305 [Xanthomonas sp. DM-2023]WOS53249.1 hypothetical protein QN244_20310 [Xanthomonas sp. DM-2023]WOS57432.1 hypothetical protein QN245_20305 [Xanthomonas sp. DM-2023]
MTTELINELRSAAATLRKPLFPRGEALSTDLTAADLLERAADSLEALRAISSTVERTTGQLARPSWLEGGEEAVAIAIEDGLVPGYDAASERALGVLDVIAENLFDRVRRGVLTPAQAAAKVRRHTAELRDMLTGASEAQP